MPGKNQNSLKRRQRQWGAAFCSYQDLIWQTSAAGQDLSGQKTTYRSLYFWGTGFFSITMTILEIARLNTAQTDHNGEARNLSLTFLLCSYPNESLPSNWNSGIITPSGQTYHRFLRWMISSLEWGLLQVRWDALNSKDSKGLWNAWFWSDTYRYQYFITWGKLSNTDREIQFKIG